MEFCAKRKTPEAIAASRQLLSPRLGSKCVVLSEAKLQKHDRESGFMAGLSLDPYKPRYLGYGAFVGPFALVP
jgi:hypothetical protein